MAAQQSAEAPQEIESKKEVILLKKGATAGKGCHCQIKWTCILIELELKADKMPPLTTD